MAAVANAGLLTASSTVAKQVLLQNRGEFATGTCNFSRQTSRQQGDFFITCAARAKLSAVVDESRTTFESFYTLLGINQQVSHREIKSAYRQMALKYHPDVCPPAKREECTRIFLQVQEAYDMLSDPERRAEYDYELICQNRKTWGFTDPSSRSSKTSKDNWSELWRSQWLKQLHILKQKKAMDQFSDSWGARMRRTTYAGDQN